MSPIVRIVKLLSLLHHHHHHRHHRHHPQKDPINKLSNQSQRRRRHGWCGHVDLCCWSVGYVCTTWWFLVFVYNSMVPSLNGEIVGVKLKREGVRVAHPVVVVGGGDLEVWQGKACAEGLFRQRLWGGGFGDIYRRPQCWMEHMSIDRETGLDPAGIRVRPVPGLVGTNYFVGLIENLARIGYEGKNVYMATYDLRLSFHNTEVRDQSLSRLKSTIELMVRTNGGKKVVVVPYSMGALYFLHFLKWVEAPPPMGGGGGRDWCSKHIKAIMNVEPQFLGAPKAMSEIFSDEAKDISSAIRAMSSGVLDTNGLGFQTLQHIMRVSRTWDSIYYLLPKGGNTYFGVLDQSTEASCDCDRRTKKTEILSLLSNQAGRSNESDGKEGIKTSKMARYGSLLSLLNIASWSSSEFSTAETKHKLSAESTYLSMESSGVQVKAAPNELDDSSIQIVVEKKLAISKTTHDLLQFIAPKLTQRATSHFSNGIADDLDDLKYSHYKYWSNPLEARLPEAPDTEIYCLYGVDNRFHADEDENFSLLSAGFMCAKGWHGQTQFNPSGMRTYVREYQNTTHGDIMRSESLIEDILRVASGDQIGGDQIHSSIRNISDRKCQNTVALKLLLS